MSTLCLARLKSANAQTELLAAWEFAYKFIPCYLAVEVWGMTECGKERVANKGSFAYFDEDYDISFSPVEAIAHNLLELLSVFSSSGMLNLVIKLSIYHLVNALFHYYIMSAYELRTWSCNHLYFVAPPDHESLRGKVLNIINDII
jgi:hypothetical protein